MESTMWGLSSFCTPAHLSVHKMCQLGSVPRQTLSVCVCLAMASASLAAGISQSRDRTCCLSGCRVAMVTMSASLRCFWETIPHPIQPVWEPATGHSFFFFFLISSSLTVGVFSLLFVLSFIVSLNTVRGFKL